MRLLSFLTTSTTLSKIRNLVLKEEAMITELSKMRLLLAKHNSPETPSRTQFSNILSSFRIVQK
jgi:hypothetical protein